MPRLRTEPPPAYTRFEATHHEWEAGEESGREVKDSDRFKLRFGKYQTPAFRYGATVRCEVFGEVKIVGLSDGRIPWPIGARGRYRTLVIFKGLAKAVRNESNQAVCHWWGLTPQTISKWRKALGVKRINAGTFATKSEYAQEPWAVKARRKAVSKARDPERVAKIAASRRGKPLAASVRAALRKANLGKKASEATRQKMSEAAKAWGTWPPAAGRAWTAKEDRLALTLPTAQAAKRTGRTVSAVESRRGKLRKLQRGS